VKKKKVGVFGLAEMTNLLAQFAKGIGTMKMYKLKWATARAVMMVAVTIHSLQISTLSAQTSVGRPVWKYTPSPIKGPCKDSRLFKYVDSGDIDPNKVVQGENYKGYTNTGPQSITVHYWDMYSFDKWSRYLVCRNGVHQYEWDIAHRVQGCRSKAFSGYIQITPTLTTWRKFCPKI
jgi:hypothetical protein